MTRVLRSIALAEDPVALPGPGSWDTSTQAIHDQGREEGYAEGYAAGRAAGFTAGRDELTAIAASLREATATCIGEVRAAHRELVERIVELAELYAVTVARRLPDPSARGLLDRVAEALGVVEPAALELAVPPTDVDEVSRLLATGEDGPAIRVVGGHHLRPGEYRLRGEYAEVDGTWERYLDAAQEAISSYLADREGDGA